MSIKSKNYASVKCPFYLHDKKSEIGCEGFVDNMERLKIEFNCMDAKEVYMNHFCKKKYCDCGLFKTKMDIYDKYDNKI